MQHLQMELLALAYKILIERNDVTIPDSQTGCIEIKCRILLGSNTDTYVDWHLDQGVQCLEFVHIVQNRNDILPA